VFHAEAVLRRDRVRARNGCRYRTGTTYATKNRGVVARESRRRSRVWGSYAAALTLGTRRTRDRPGCEAGDVTAGVETLEHVRRRSTISPSPANHIHGTPAEVREPARGRIEAIYAKIQPPRKSRSRGRQPRREPTAKKPPVDLADEEVIRPLSESPKQRNLQRTVERQHSRGIPLRANRQALCNLLCFYTRDPLPIARLWKQSGSYREEARAARLPAAHKSPQPCRV